MNRTSNMNLLKMVIGLAAGAILATLASFPTLAQTNSPSPASGSADETTTEDANSEPEQLRQDYGTGQETEQPESSETPSSNSSDPSSADQTTTEDANSESEQLEPETGTPGGNSSN